jgi:hypothetical protein
MLPLAALESAFPVLLTRVKASSSSRFPDAEQASSHSLATIRVEDFASWTWANGKMSS